MEKYLCIFLLSVLAEAETTLRLASSYISVLDSTPFLYGLNSQCPVTNPFPPSITQVDGELFEKAMNSLQRNEYTAIMFYDSLCPFSSIFLSKFSSLSAMYPQIRHIMVERSSAMPSVFSQYGIHTVPALLVVNQTKTVKYHGKKDIQSLINFYKRTTGLHPVVEMVDEAWSSSQSGQKPFKRESMKDTLSREPYLLLATAFIVLRAFMYLFPSHLVTVWIAHIPRLDLAIFAGSRHLLEQLLHLLDVNRVWTKLNVCKTRNFQKGARNAQVWASSLSSSMSLGKPSSSRVDNSMDL